MGEQVPAARPKRPSQTATETADRTLHLVQRGEGPPLPPPMVVFETKLQAPSQRAALVPRPRLVALLEQGSPGQLTVVNAPAGWGKTSLLAEWHAATANPASFAWLALDSTDHDPVRFRAYVIEALRHVYRKLGVSSREEAVARAGELGLSQPTRSRPCR